MIISDQTKHSRI